MLVLRERFVGEGNGLVTSFPKFSSPAKEYAASDVSVNAIDELLLRLTDAGTPSGAATKSSAIVLCHLSCERDG